MSATIFLFLGGLVALGFLIVVWRRRQMPLLLRAILIIAAAVIVIYVAWTFAMVLGAGKYYSATATSANASISAGSGGALSRGVRSR